MGMAFIASIFVPPDRAKKKQCLPEGTTKIRGLIPMIPFEKLSLLPASLT